MGAVPTGIVPVLCQSKPGTPLLRARMNETSEECFHALVNTLSLPVRRGVVWCAHAQSCICQAKKFLPETAGEDGITIGQERIRQAVQSIDLIDIHRSYLCCREWVCQWYEVAIFGELIDNHQNTVIASYCGSPSTKSSETICQARSGIGKGSSSPG